VNESGGAEVRKRTYRANISAMNQSQRLVEIIFIVRDQRFQWSHFVFFKMVHIEKKLSIKNV
jgi:hypothetical protein